MTLCSVLCIVDWLKILICTKCIFRRATDTKIKNEGFGKSVFRTEPHCNLLKTPDFVGTKENSPRAVHWVFVTVRL